MDDAGKGSRATRRQVLGATAGALAVGALPGRTGAQQASGSTVYVGSSGNYDNNYEDAALYAVDAATGSQEWAFTQPSDDVLSSPTVYEETVYVGSNDATLYAVDAATGEQEWAFTQPSDYVDSSPTVYEETVYVGSGDGTLYAVDAATGEQEWAFTQPSDYVDSSPTVYEETVYVGSGDGTLYAVDAATGSQEWAFTQPSSRVRSSPTVYEETVYVGSDDSTLYAVDTATGTQQWAFTQPSGPVCSSPTVADGIVYVGSDSGTLYAVDAATGEQEWALTQPPGPVYSSPTVYEETVYVGSWDRGSDSGTLYAVDTATGIKEWAFTQPSGPVYSSPTVYEGTVYVGSDDSTLYAVDAATGEEEWALTQPSDDVYSSPTVADGTVYVGSGDGTLGHYGDRADSSPSGDDVGSPGDDSGSPDDGGPSDGGDTSDDSADSDSSGDGGLGTTEIAAIGGGGGLALLFGAYALMRRSGDDSDSTSESTPDTSTGGESSGQPSPSPGPDRGATRQRGGSDAGGVPSRIPDTPRPSLSYEDITLGDPLGRGGNADVYHATAATPQGEIELAVKEPRMGGGETLDTRVVERMMDEAETWEQLDGHDHVAGVVDYGTKPLPWIAMEYMDGGHLGERADEMDTAQKLWTALSVTEGVYHAHNRGIAHRDLKPENILFRRVDGVWDVPKVADWGLSKHLLEHSKSRDGMTVEYAAPEQFSDSRSTDDRTDIYQLGAVFYELFTGQPPFEGEMFAVMKQIENERPTPPSESADVPGRLDDVLLTAMAKHPGDRYSDIVYLRDDLQELRESRS